MKKQSGRLIPYRDIHGREIICTFGAGGDDIPKAIRAKLILCPETQGLRALRWCKGCKFDDGHTATDQICKSDKKYEHPEWYSIHKITVKEIIINKQSEK